MSKKLPGDEPAEVARVICASVSLVQGSVMDELFHMRNRFCVSGHDPLVKGALMYASGCFVFWVEGQADAVQKVVEGAALDHRNDRQVVIHRSRGPASLTEPFSVAVTQGADGHAAFQLRIRHFRNEMERGGALEPAAIWQCLVAPCTVAAEGGHARVPERHVALVSAEDNGPIDLLRKLGERFGTRVVYQRFASAKSHSSDVGLAYVDLRADGHVTRVHLVSRRALGQPIVRQSLEGLHELVMLMGSRPAYAIDLAAGVADCVKAMARPPAICQVTDRDEVAATIERLLQRSGATDEGLRVTQLREPQLEGYLLGRGQRAAHQPELACS